VFGYVASRCTSYALGIGPSERSWGDVKHINTGKRSHMSAAATKKRSILNTTARVTDSRIRRTVHEQLGMEGRDALIDDDDDMKKANDFNYYFSHQRSSIICSFSFDPHLQNFGVDTDALREPVSKVELLKMNDLFAEAKLSEKYKDLAFYDPDTQVNFIVHADNLDFRRGKDGGWNLIGNSFDDGLNMRGLQLER